MSNVDSELQHGRHRLSRRIVALSAGCLLILVISGWWFTIRPSNEDLLAQARLAHVRGDYEASIQLATIVIDRSADTGEALLIAAQSEESLGDIDQAIRYYDRVQKNGSKTAETALAEAGQLLLFKMNRVTDAEQRFLDLLDHQPTNINAINRLVHIYSTQGRTFECVEMLHRQIQSRTFTVDHLLMIGQRSPAVDNSSVIDAWRDANPNDVIPMISQARNAVSRNQLSDAERILRNVLSQAPAQIEAQALLGLVLLESGDAGKFINWHHAVTSGAESHPLVWLVRGHWARRLADNSTAVRCYWESLKREPQQKAAAFQLGQTLLTVGQQDRGNRFLEHARSLDRLNRELDHILTHQQDFEAVQRVAGQMESMGRLWEAWGWSQWVAATKPDIAWAAEMAARIAPLLKKETPLTLRSHHPGLQLDWSMYPLPQWNRGTTLQDSKQASVAFARSVTFTDATASTGIDFAYFNGCDDQGKERRIHEQMGGGIAVIDFDQDSWPDLYFTQGSTWPPATEPGYLDRLFRNEGNGTFRDVTSSCLIQEKQYGQGITVGDLNSDGFPDIYVANIGANQLYQNNGDGTFIDVTTLDTEGNDWTTSCVLADLNGDSHPDLYAVNYVVGDQVYSKVCRDAEGQPRICSPAEFSPAPDRLYVSSADGDFAETRSWTVSPSNTGNGLGIVAADFDRSGSLSLFVANDQTANFFLHTATHEHGEKLSLVEDALATGLAYDLDGLSQACMGIAADDANGDGQLDVFVTNFSNESNVLYLQQGDGFVDATRRAGLRNSSFTMLGFGTQFLDGELDGLPDLVVANGHVDNSGKGGNSYQMYPQYFSNAGDCRFAELPPHILGSYFQTKHVGRSVVRLDWNRDGLEEFVVSHLDAPVAIMQNDTPNTGRHIGVQLVGVLSSRDAIGTSVTVTTNGSRRSRQLTAGDGYQASNERLLIFGLKDNELADQVDVAWPSGLKQTFNNIQAGANYVIVESREQILRLPE